MSATTDGLDAVVQRTPEDAEHEDWCGREVIIYRSGWPFAAVLIVAILCFTFAWTMIGMGYITHPVR